MRRERAQALEKEMALGGELDSYEFEGPDRAEFLQDLAEFQLAVVGMISPLLTKYAAALHHTQQMQSTSEGTCWRLVLQTCWNRARW